MVLFGNNLPKCRLVGDNKEKGTIVSRLMVHSRPHLLIATKEVLVSMLFSCLMRTKYYQLSWKMVQEKDHFHMKDAYGDEVFLYEVKKLVFLIIYFGRVGHDTFHSPHKKLGVIWNEFSFLSQEAWFPKIGSWYVRCQCPVDCSILSNWNTLFRNTGLCM